MRPSLRNQSRGFTLTELAIVLVVAGVIIGAIWVAAGTAWGNYRVTRVNQQVATTVMNIRDYFQSCQQLTTGVACSTSAATGPNDITSLLDGLNLLPVEMRRTTIAGTSPIDHALNNNFTNGSFHVSSVVCPTGAGLRCFMVSMMGLTQSPCIKLLTSAPINDTELGVVKIGAQNMVSNTTTMTLPISPAIAQGWCNQTGANADKNEVDIVFKLHN